VAKTRRTPAAPAADAVYTLEHPAKPQCYVFRVHARPAAWYKAVTVEKWEGGKLVQSSAKSKTDARRLYGYLRGRVGYVEFGFLSDSPR
jgi:hypothetical protein